MSAQLDVPKRPHPIAVDVSQLSHDEWLAMRRKTIGASEIAAVLGLNPYCSALKIFLQKTGQIAPDPENERMKIGLLAEPMLAGLYTERTGRRVRRVRQMLYHPEHRFLHANLDRVCVGERRIVELKMAGEWVARTEFGEPGSDFVPFWQLVQTQQQMLITGYEVADIGVLMGGNRFETFTIPFDPEVGKAIIEGGRDFAERIARNEPPEPRDVPDVLLRFPRSEPQPVEASAEIARVMDDLADTKREIETLNEQFEALKLEVCTFMGPCDELRYLDTTLATWKSVKAREMLDAARLKAERPQIYAEYVKTAAPSRQFLVKKAGSK